MSVRHLSAPAAAWSGMVGEDGKGKGASHVPELVSVSRMDWTLVGVSRNIMGLGLGFGWVSVKNGLVYVFQY